MIPNASKGPCTPSAAHFVRVTQHGIFVRKRSAATTHPRMEVTNAKTMKARVEAPEFFTPLQNVFVSQLSLLTALPHSYF